MPAEPANAASRDQMCDVAFIGEPRSTWARSTWRREIDLLRRAGWRVVTRKGGAGRVTLDAAIVVVADPNALRGVELAAADAQLVLRHADEGTVRRLPALVGRLGRRLVLAPAHALERRSLAAHLPGRWFTAEDWPSPLSDEGLHAVARKQPGQPLSVGIVTDAGSHLSAERRSAALRGLGVGSEAVHLRALPLAELASSQLDGLDVLIGPPRSDVASMPDLALQAIERGVLVALSDAWKPCLRDAAVFWDWGQVAERLAELATDDGLWRRQFLEVLDRALGRFGEEAYLERLRAGTLGPACPPRMPNPGALARPRDGAMRCDLVVIGDFRRREEANEQLLAQIAHHAASGHRVALYQAWNGRTGPTIHPGIEACLYQGSARLCRPGDVVEAAAAQILLPRLTIPALDRMRPAIVAKQWHIVETAAELADYDPARLHTSIERLYDVRPVWHGVRPEVQAALAACVPTEGHAWPVMPAPNARRGRQNHRRCIVGVVAYTPADASRALDALAPTAGDRRIERRVLLCGSRRTFPARPDCPTQVLGIDGADLARFVSGLDLLVVPPEAKRDHVPQRAVSEALERGLAVLATPEQALALEAGPTHLAVSDWPDFVSKHARRKSAAPPAPSIADPASLAARLHLPKQRKRRRARAKPSVDRILFVTANGVGLGHITRLAAIARRLPTHLAPVFATMSQAAAVLEQMGFSTELLATYTGKSAKPWNAFTRERMHEILDYHQPAALVLDASNPYQGVIEAAAPRNGLKLVWVRRGMWRATQDNAEFLTRSPYFDLVIEPDDIAGARDAERRQRATGDTLRVPPISLLDPREILDRASARRALGLPEEPENGSVLVQLGSGTTRDLNRLLSQVLDVLHRFPGLEIVLAQWLNAPTAYQGRWRNARLLSGYPIPRYYRAFDFTISAAGYNSFNDLLRFGLPTIFIANDAACMDDQGARARHAEAAGAAFDIDENDLDALEGCVQALLQPAVRDYLAERARRLARPNGARAAARAIARLLD